MNQSYKTSLEYLRNRASERSAVFIEQNGAAAMIFSKKKRLWTWLMGQVPSEGLMMECGVFEGTSINTMADLLPSREFFGFDSFEGLSEDWLGVELAEGAFDLGGKLPDVRKNVTLSKGWVDDTLPPFLKENSGPIAFLHIDTDTYSPAKTILALAETQLVKGSIVLFDELIGYPFWENGEYKALDEELGSRSYEYIAFSPWQAAIRMLD